MGIFTDAGVSRGNLAFNQRTNKRRSELAGLFEEFKKNNPYATAQDYNQYIESVVGPQEMYLRGNLPAGDMLARMGEDNQRRKVNDEHRQSVETAAKELAVRSQLQNMASSLVLNNTNDEVYNALAPHLPGATADERERSMESIKQMLGNVDNLRETKRQDLYDSQLTSAIDMIRRTNGQIPVDQIIAKFKTRFPNENVPGLKGYADQLKQDITDNRNIKLSENKSRLQGEVRSVMNSVDTNPRLPYQLTPGSDEYQNGLDWIEEQVNTLQFFGTPEEVAQQKADLRDRMIKQAQGTRTTILSQTRKKNVATLAGDLTKSMQQKYEDQQKEIEYKRVQAGIQDQSPEHGILKEAATRWEIPSQLEDNLIKFVKDGNYSSPVSAVDEWYASLPESQRSTLLSPSQFRGRAIQQAGEFYPEQEDAKTFMASMGSSLKQVQNKDQNTVDHFRNLVGSTTPTYHGMEKAISDINTVLQNVGRRVSAYDTRVERLLSGSRDWLVGSDPIDPDRVSSELTNAHQNITDETIAQLKELRRQAATKLKSLDPKNEYHKAGTQVSEDGQQPGTNATVPLQDFQGSDHIALPPTPELGATRDDWIEYYKQVERIQGELDRNGVVGDKQTFMRLTEEAKANAIRNIEKEKVNAIRTAKDFGANSQQHRNATGSFLNARPYYGDQ